MTALMTCATNEALSHQTITDTYDYDAFGNKINSTGTTPNNYLYQGEEYDPDLGLYYLSARYYNPLTGGFMSQDPERVWHCTDGICAIAGRSAGTRKATLLTARVIGA